MANGLYIKKLVTLTIDDFYLDLRQFHRDKNKIPASLLD